MPKQSFLKYFFLVSLLALQSCANTPEKSCSDNWQITGYYTPVEKNHHGKKTSIKVKNEKRYAFPKSFIDAVKIEGWGKTRFGWYLGYYGRKWHKSQWPLDSTGRPLIQGIAATDPGVIAKGSSIKINSKISYLNNTKFIVRDVGSKIKNRHIDIYTGEGKSAKKRTFEITGKHFICVYRSI